jgi:hypothetical protein
MLGTPKGLSDEKAARMMVALREGRTLRTFGVKSPRLEAYFNAHPEFAQEALPLIEENKRAARLRKGARLTAQSTAGRKGRHRAIDHGRAPRRIASAGPSERSRSAIRQSP